MHHRSSFAMSRVCSILAAPWRASSLPGTARALSMVAAAAGASGLSLEEQLARAPWLQLLKVPGMGRGLFAATDIEQGTVLHEEAPMICTPHPQALSCTCHACLRPLAPSLSTVGSTSALPFCSPSCLSAADAAWAAAAAACEFQGLQLACEESREKFPLMVARLACLTVQREQQSAAADGQRAGSQQAGPVGSTGSGGGRCSDSGDSGSEATAAQAVLAAAGEQEAPSRGVPLTELRFLCFANMAEPPQPWVQLHSLLLQGLQPLAGSSTWPGVTRGWLAERFSLRWFCDALARLHLNAFRVDTVPPWHHTDPAALLKAAAASLGGGFAAGASSAEGAAAPVHLPGSAAFLLASMLNHSCEPNLDISWPHNNAVARFTAARDIAAHEQLTISYVDAEQGVAQRRQQLEFAYGFTCRCPRCREEAGEVVS